jgi:hypothetical protein
MVKFGIFPILRGQKIQKAPGEYLFFAIAIATGKYGVGHEDGPVWGHEQGGGAAVFKEVAAEVRIIARGAGARCLLGVGSARGVKGICV